MVFAAGAMIGAVGVAASSNPKREAKAQRGTTAPVTARATPTRTEGAGGDGSGSPKLFADFPPVVLNTVPKLGAEDVNPGLTEIKVTFSKPMADGSWSWVTYSEETFPKTTGKPHYEKERLTCVLPVKLKPSTTYAVMCNSGRFGNFKDANGTSAVPYLLVFRTGK